MEETRLPSLTLSYSLTLTRNEQYKPGPPLDGGELSYPFPSSILIPLSCEGVTLNERNCEAHIWVY